METTIQSVSELITRLILEAPNQRILGAQLGALLKLTCPTFSPSEFQSRNLKQFIRTHVPAVGEKGRSGPDSIYGLASSADPQPFEGGPVSPRSPIMPTWRTSFDWKAFSNPSYPFILAANRETGEFQSLSPSVAPSAPWVVLPKPTPEDHLRIAREYVQTLSSPTREVLEGVLASPAWYVTFSSVAKRHGVGSEWASFRTSRLRTAFDASITAAGIPAKSNKWNIAGKLRPAVTTRSVGVRAPFDASSSSSENALRRLVALVIADLPLGDLRELALPIGRVFDHIDEILK